MLWSNGRIVVWWLSHWQALLVHENVIEYWWLKAKLIRDQIKDNRNFICVQFFTDQHEIKKSLIGRWWDKLFLWHVGESRLHAWVAFLLRNKRREKENFTGRTLVVSYLFLLAPECLPAGGSSVRYYRETKPDPKNMYRLCPHPINFVINKWDSYRTACTAVSRNNVLWADLWNCLVVLRATVVGRGSIIHCVRIENIYTDLTLY